MLYIDASRYMEAGNRTGVENYSYHLIRALAELSPKEIHLISPRKIDLPVAQTVIRCPRLWTTLRLSAHVAWNQLPNLFVPSHVLPLITPQHSVITVHDTAWRRFPKSYSLWQRLFLEWTTRRAVKKATAILTPSQATQQDLIEFYGADPNRIHVTALGIEPANEGLNPNSTGTPQSFPAKDPKRPYLLYIGRLEHKKNIDTLLKAFAQIYPKQPLLRLVLAGGQGVGAKAFDSLFKAIPKGQVEQTGYIDEADKTRLLNGAAAFIFPSRYEGFGLPILEAMQAKLPLVLSNIPSSRELAGDCAWFFETENVEALAAAIEQALMNENQNQKHLAKYDAILKAHTWQACAQETLKILGHFND